MFRKASDFSVRDLNPVHLVSNTFALLTDNEVRKEWLTEMGFVYTGCGSFKTAYRNEEWGIVVKLVHNSSGACEAQNYETAPEGARPHLLPLLDHGRGYQVQEYVVRHKCPPSCTGWVQGVHDSDTRNHTHMEDGTLVIWDYGQTNQWTGEEFCTHGGEDEECSPMPESPESEDTSWPESEPEVTPESEPDAEDVEVREDEAVRIRIVNAE